MHFTNKDHTFAVCAYKESPYLPECIESLEKQSVETNIIIATSTPNDWIYRAAKEHQIPVFVNHGESGIAGDWNFALSCAKTKLVTIAHQDDIYERKYAEEMLRAVNKVKEPIIFSCNYGEIRNGNRVCSNTLLNIKKVLRIPMRLFPESKAARRLSLAFGDSICCPSVTYNRKYTDLFPFTGDFKADLDWQEWERLSRVEGSFAYSDDYLMFHRIHEESETSHVIEETGRKGEDYAMFLKFWPEPIARKLSGFYSEAEKSNKT